MSPKPGTGSKRSGSPKPAPAARLALSLTDCSRLSGPRPPSRGPRRDHGRSLLPHPSRPSGGFACPQTRVPLGPSGWAREIQTRAFEEHAGTPLRFLGIQHAVAVGVHAGHEVHRATTHASRAAHPGSRASSPVRRASCPGPPGIQAPASAGQEIRRAVRPHAAGKLAPWSPAHATPFATFPVAAASLALRPLRPGRCAAAATNHKARTTQAEFEVSCSWPTHHLRISGRTSRRMRTRSPSHYLYERALSQRDRRFSGPGTYDAEITLPR